MTFSPLDMFSLFRDDILVSVRNVFLFYLGRSYTCFGIFISGRFVILVAIFKRVSFSRLTFVFGVLKSYHELLYR